MENNFSFEEVSPFFFPLPYLTLRHSTFSVTIATRYAAIVLYNTVSSSVVRSKLFPEKVYLGKLSGRRLTCSVTLSVIHVPFIFLF